MISESWEILRNLEYIPNRYEKTKISTKKLKITTKNNKSVPKSAQNCKINLNDSQKPKSVKNQSSLKNKGNAPIRCQKSNTNKTYSPTTETQSSNPRTELKHSKFLYE